jgi:hypothetical protein
MWVHHLVADLVQAGTLPYFVGLLARTPALFRAPADAVEYTENRLKKPKFPGIFDSEPKNPC